MPKKNSYLTFKDLFCGAGGSSQGVRNLSRKQGGGIEVKVALNHWPLAIETHNTNFPETMHDCTDISASDPRRYPSTDVLIASPECTNHSPASGRKRAKTQIELFKQGKLDPAAERSRATMWDVVRFSEFHKYNAIIVENVVEARSWVPFESWLHAMRSLGYEHKCVYLNSMHCHPTPQSRDRMYIVFWRKGNRAPNLDFTPAAYCQNCGKDVHSVQTWKNPNVKAGKYKTQYLYCCPSCGRVVEPYYYAAFNCIDWSDLGTRIGDRRKKLVPKTMTRIEAGIEKYGSSPFQVVNYSPGYTKSMSDSLGAITSQDHHGLFVPFIVKLEHDYKAAPASQPLRPQTVRHTDMLVTANVKSAGEALPTQTTCQGMGVVTPPFLTVMRGQSTTISSMDPLNCISAGGIHSGLVTTDSWNSFLASNYNGSLCLKHISQEMGSLTAVDRHGLASFKTPDIEDCFYRMLKAPEVKRGMAFADDYVVLGNSRDQVKQCGNAVTPPAMEMLAERVVDSFA